MLESERKLHDTEKSRECSEKACFDVYKLSLKEYGNRWSMGNKVQVFLDLYNWQGFFKEEYIDFLEELPRYVRDSRVLSQVRQRHLCNFCLPENQCIPL